ncbi:hypothetical protein SAMN02927924_00963 [Sphingobium faniae]|nr:hypothetical protein SAMN02927924_00963 [Sphingobium faniae]
MPLTFPTLAEQAIAAYEANDRKGSFNKIALKMGAFRDDDPRGNKGWPMIIWVFPDETTVEVHGRGRSYKLVAETP